MRVAPLVLLVCFAAGCDSSDSPPPPPAPLTPTVPIDAGNALDVAQAAVRAAFDIQRVAFIGATFLLTDPPEPPATPATSPLTLSTTIPGPEGGEAVFSWEDRDLGGFYNTGDVITLSLDAYGADGLVLDGGMVIDNIVSFGELPNPIGTWIANADLYLLSLSVQVGAATQVLNLTLPFRLERRVIVQLFDCVLPENITWGPIELQKGNRMSRYDSEEEVSYIFDGDVFSTPLDGVLHFETDGVLGGFPFFPDPILGVMRVDGLAPSVMEVEFGFFVLEIRVDEDGDDEFETSIMSSMMELLPM
jgi:hypothetical protein